MILELSKCKLRPWHITDAPSLVLNANNKNVIENLRDVFPYPYTNNDARFFITHIANSTNNLIMAIDVEGDAVGSIGIHPQADIYRKNAELGYWLGEKYWGKGIASEAVNAIVEYAFKHFDIHKIFANVFERNKASMKVLEKCGFTCEAIHRQAIVKGDAFMDEYMYVRFSDGI
jgi:[ribosomal protein S5]-alanine N-acetyltransferase